MVVFLLIVSAFPIAGNIKFLTVLSGSMEPKIHTGSVVMIKSMENYQVGDVITFGENSKKKKPTTHRIAEVKKDAVKGEISYITKGDANNAPDQTPVTPGEILGKVFLSIPYFGYAVSAAQKPIGFILIVIVPAVIIIYDEILNIKKEILKKMDYRRRIKKREERKEEENTGE